MATPMEVPTTEITETNTDEQILQELKSANEKYDSIIKILEGMTSEEVEENVLETETNIEQTFDTFQQYIVDSQKVDIGVGICIIFILLVMYGSDLARVLFRKM